MCVCVCLCEKENVCGGDGHRSVVFWNEGPRWGLTTGSLWEMYPTKRRRAGACRMSEQRPELRSCIGKVDLVKEDGRKLSEKNHGQLLLQREQVKLGLSGQPCLTSWRDRRTCGFYQV